MVEDKIDTKIVKIEAEAEVNHGIIKQDTKNDKDKEYPAPAESRNLHSDRKNKHKFGKLNRPSKQQKNKSTFDVVVIEPIRNEETEERRQSQTVIVPDTQEIDGDQQSMAKTQIIFCSMDRVQHAPIKQTENNSPQSHKFI